MTEAFANAPWNEKINALEWQKLTMATGFTGKKRSSAPDR